MALNKTISFSNDSGISTYGNLFQGIPILQGSKLCSRPAKKIKLFCACVEWFHHTLRTQTVVLTRKNALPVVLIQGKLNSEDTFHNSERVS